jgi:hypothetical protein
MTSAKQAESNHRNASKSTGPKTAEGKAASSLNALRHGLRSRTFMQPGDDQEEYNQLCADLQDALKPQDRPEQLLLEKMAIAEWQLVRLQRSESILLLDQEGIIDASHIPLFDRLSQFQARLERTSIRVYKELLQLAKIRQQQQDNQPVKEVIVRWVDTFESKPAAASTEDPSNTGSPAPPLARSVPETRSAAESN